MIRDVFWLSPVIIIFKRHNSRLNFLHLRFSFRLSSQMTFFLSVSLSSINHLDLLGLFFLVKSSSLIGFIVLKLFSEGICHHLGLGLDNYLFVVSIHGLLIIGVKFLSYTLILLPNY